MKNIKKLFTFSCFVLIITSSILNAQTAYTNAIMPKLPNAFDMFIGREGNNELPQYIKPDYFRDDYKRTLPNLKKNTREG